MARSRKTTTAGSKGHNGKGRKSASEPAMVRPAFEEKPLDILIPFGFVLQVDADLTVRDGEVPTKERLKHAANTMMLRHEDAIKAALTVVFGERVSFIETADAYTGDPKTGVLKQIRKEAPIPGMAQPAAPAEPETAEVVADYSELTVKELREACKAEGLKTLGNKAALIKRLEKHDSES